MISRGNKNKVIHFMVQDVRMCVYLNDVIKILPLMDIKKIPESPNYMTGLMNIHGKSIPVIDMAIRSGLTRNLLYSVDMPILLCQFSEKITGIIVDKIIGILDINDSSLQMTEDFKNSLFLASVMDEIEPSLLINVSNLVSGETDGHYL